MQVAKSLFIVGVGRSGTSLLQSIIGTHSCVEVVPETSFLRRYVYNKHLTWDRLYDDQTLLRLPSLISAINNCQNERSRMIWAYKNTLLHSSKKNYVLDKDPRLIEYIDLLNLTNTDCKIILIRRDPRDVLLSKKLAKWSKGRTILSYLMASYIQLSDGWHHRNDKNFHLIDYELLLQEPKRQLQKLCHFLELEFESNMLNFQETSKKLIQKDELSWKKETMQPLLASNFGKWKDALTDVEAHASFLVAKSADPSISISEELNHNLVTKFKSLLLLNIVKIMAIPYRFQRKKNQDLVKSEIVND